jgi:hypothetical protein
MALVGDVVGVDPDDADVGARALLEDAEQQAGALIELPDVVGDVALAQRARR